MPHEESDGWRQYLDEDTEPFSQHEMAPTVATPILTLLYHPDSRRVGERSLLSLSSSRRQTAALSRLEPLFYRPFENRGRPLAVSQLSRKPISLSPEPGGELRLVCSKTRTAVFADGEKVQGETRFSQQKLKRGVVLVLANRVVILLHLWTLHESKEPPSFGLVGESEAMLRLRHKIEQVSQLDIPILLRGATGTGKELVAQAIHRAGPRRDRPYLTVNMGAIPPTLAASELFGTAKGAFTGADRERPGYFRRADGGTLFLDEIGETPADVQPLLLRVLESGEIQPVGNKPPVHVRVQIIAATDIHLEDAIDRGRFRAPLLHRLSSYSIHLPTLRERRDDFGRLLFFFLEQELTQTGHQDLIRPDLKNPRPWLSANAVAFLAAYGWPGNVRQLRNLARQIVVDFQDLPEVRIDQLESLLTASPPTKADVQTVEPRPKRHLREISEDALIKALRSNLWHPGATARQLGISRSAVYKLIDAYPNTRKAADLSPEEIDQAARQCGGHLDAMAKLLEVSAEALKRHMNRLEIHVATPRASDDLDRSKS